MLALLLVLVCYPLLLHGPTLILATSRYYLIILLGNLTLFWISSDSYLIQDDYDLHRVQFQIGACALTLFTSAKVSTTSQFCCLSTPPWYSTCILTLALTPGQEPKSKPLPSNPPQCLFHTRHHQSFGSKESFLSTKLHIQVLLNLSTDYSTRF